MTVCTRSYLLFFVILCEKICQSGAWPRGQRLSFYDNPDRMIQVKPGDVVAFLVNPGDVVASLDKMFYDVISAWWLQIS